MKRSFAIGFALLLLGCLFASVCAWAQLGALRWARQDTESHLEILAGKTRRQQWEYDQLMAELPLLRAQAAEILPQAEAAAQQRDGLKAQRRALRRAIEAAEQALAEAEYTAAWYERLRLKEELAGLEAAP